MTIFWNLVCSLLIKIKGGRIPKEFVGPVEKGFTAGYEEWSFGCFEMGLREGSSKGWIFPPVDSDATYLF